MTQPAISVPMPDAAPPRQELPGARPVAGSGAHRPGRSLWRLAFFAGGDGAATTGAILAAFFLFGSYGDRPPEDREAAVLRRATSVPWLPPPSPALPATPAPTTTSLLSDRTGDCEAIEGTPYRSELERGWYLENCITSAPTNGTGESAGALPVTTIRASTPVFSEARGHGLYGSLPYDEGLDWRAKFPGEDGGITHSRSVRQRGSATGAL